MRAGRGGEWGIFGLHDIFPSPSGLQDFFTAHEGGEDIESRNVLRFTELRETTFKLYTIQQNPET